MLKTKLIAARAGRYDLMTKRNEGLWVREGALSSWI